MLRLTLFELQKVWGRRSFCLALCAILGLNLFFLWYTHLPEGNAPDLAAYKRFSQDIAGMSEAEKHAFVSDRKEIVDGVSFVAEILTMQQSDIGAAFAQDELTAHPGLFETWYPLYQSGEYLRYTDSLEQEAALIRELYAEENTVAGYGAYLQSIQDREDSLGGISIFAAQEQDNFAARNIRKSARDFAGLSAAHLRWTPSKGLTAALESLWTDLLLILLSFLCTAGLITEERQKGLLYITRSTRHGILACMAAKLLALLVHCIASAALLYAANLLYFAAAAGGWDGSAGIQSLAPYLESNLPIRIGTFLVLTVLTKALVLFAVGSVLLGVCALSGGTLLPDLAGMAFWAASWALYQFIPAASKYSAVKYLNLFGALRAESLYGAYLNLNVFGYPVSRRTLSWGIVALVSLAGIVLSLAGFAKTKNLGAKDAVHPVVLPFHPHASLLRHEAYKILLPNRGLAVLLVFTCLIGTNTFRQSYTPTPQEQYYQSLMLQLEGPLTEAKVELLAEEDGRYQQAFQQLAAIEAQVDAGAIDSDTADAMKMPWQSVTAFYPSFQRVQQQYERIRTRGGAFLYDTGYLYLNGALGQSVLPDFLLLTLGTILAFCPVLAVEFQSGAWPLLCATRRGKRSVLRAKLAVCALSSALFFTLPFCFRWASIAQTFPTHGLLFSARCIPYYESLPAFLPVWGLLLGKVILQVLSGHVLTFIVIALSGWRKSTVQALFFGLVLLAAPLLLALLGFTFAQSFSLYPVYADPLL